MTISTSVHSNAFNFMSFLQNGVDPRTGQYTVSINLPSLECNDLTGPGIPLTLAFNPLNTADSGYGQGWNLQLSQFTTSNEVLSLHTGETFKVTDSSKPRQVFAEQKIDSFHFYKESATRYRVMHKSGLVEILEVRGVSPNQAAVPVEIFSPQGRKISLTYDTWGSGYARLMSITDGAGVILLQITRTTGLINVAMHPFSGPDGGPLALFGMTLVGDLLVDKISLPTDDGACWRFGYEQKLEHTCLTWVETPTGGREEIGYTDGGHKFPAKSGRAPLPRVTTHLTNPGLGQGEIKVQYSYPADDHNFLGSGLSIDWSNDGLDNLYRHTSSYLYGSTETLMFNNAALRTIERTFNQFHLLTVETTTQKDNVQEVETAYDLKPDTLFPQQPATCQLPLTVTTRWRLISDPTRARSEVEHTRYDSSGNLLEKINANGITETSVWYPAAGDVGCPPDPEGFSRNIKQLTVTPATSIYPTPILITAYTYSALPALTDSGQPVWLATASEVLRQKVGTTETELQRTDFKLFNAPGNTLQHGRLEEQKVTLNQQTTTTGYAYSKLPGKAFTYRRINPRLDPKSADQPAAINVAAELFVLQTLETVTGFDLQDKKITLQHSVLTGEPLLNLDDNLIEIRYTYDALRRVLTETAAPDSLYSATRVYEYTLSASPAVQAEQRMFDVKGVCTRTVFDGLNRAVREERDDIDLNVKLGIYAGEPRQIYSALYNAKGDLEGETQFDWHAGALQLGLTSTYEYDDWGQQSSVTGPDGVKTVEITDPIGSAAWKLGPLQRSWRESSATSPVKSGVTETWMNLFEKPEKITRDPDLPKSLSVQQFFYDGLGRTAKDLIMVGEVERSNSYKYDAFDRMIENTLPDTSVVVRKYATHSKGDLPILISVDGIVLGEQAFDGLDRMITSITGGRTRSYTYDDGQTQPKTVKTPKGLDIVYTYQPRLGEEPSKRVLGTAVADYHYDPQNARLLNCTEAGERLEREYFNTGELQSEVRGEGASAYTMTYDYSIGGRLFGYTDVLKQAQTYTYNDFGLLSETALGTTKSTFSYDTFGRTSVIKTEDGAQQVTISLEYDSFDREILRTFNLNGVIQKLEQAYDAADGLTERTLSEGGVTLRKETYEYDNRGRLTRYDCSGPQPPVDPYGKPILSQVFSFSPLDNLRLVYTTYATEPDVSTHRATYEYGNPAVGEDPAQLLLVKNVFTPPDSSYPAEIKLTYDPDGNLISDEQGRILDYDGLGRLISVSAADGGPGSQYRYDPLDTLAGKNDSDGAEQRFYRDGDLANQINGSQGSTFMRGADHLLAEQQTGSGAGKLLLASNQSNSVVSEISAGKATDVAYSAYGQRNAEPAPISRLGFNGEYCETQTGCYLLGNGYRSFSPGLMRFSSPDSLSPFGEGGPNCYAYCDGDPVNGVDPSGHSWVGKILRLSRKTTGSRNTKHIPEGFKKENPNKLLNSKGSSDASLKSVTPEDKLNAERLINIRKEIEKAAWKHQSRMRERAVENPVTKKQEYFTNKYEQAKAAYDQAVSDVQEANAQFRYIIKYSGSARITRHSADAIAAEIREYYGNNTRHYKTAIVEERAKTAKTKAVHVR